MSKGKVYLVGSGPGDPGLITVRGMKLLETADVVVHDRLIPQQLLSKVRPDAKVIDVGKASEGSSGEQSSINDTLVREAKAGKTVVRLKGGDPYIFGRGGEEALELVESGIEYEVVPGISSSIAAAAYAGIPVTYRGLSSSVTIVTGHEDPTKPETAVHWDRLAKGADTLVILMGAQTLPGIVKAILGTGVEATRPAAVIQWGTDPRQRTAVGTLANIVQKVQAEKIQSPAAVVIGPVVTLREKLMWFEKRPLLGKRVLVTRARTQASKLVEQLAELGAVPVELPTIEPTEPADFKPLDDAIRKVQSYQWIIFTSVNAVDAFFGRLQKARLDSRTLSGVKVCAIGTVTLQALASHGIFADYVPEEFTTDGLAVGLGKKLDGAHILIPRADIAPEKLVNDLKKAGAQVEQVIAYRTAKPERVNKESIGKIDIATFTSSSTVKNFVEIFGDTSALNGSVIASIGPMTSTTAKEAGLNVDIEAAEHTVNGLVKAVVDYISKQGGR